MTRDLTKILRDALAPFAAVPLAYTDDIDDSATIFCVDEDDHHYLHLGDFRRVHEALRITASATALGTTPEERPCLSGPVVNDASAVAIPMNLEPGWLERQMNAADERAGRLPAWLTRRGAMMASSSAVEQRTVNAPVAGSIPASSAKTKRLRILTNRDFEDGFEAIEWDAKHRQFFWYAEEQTIGACFPCDIEFATETFAKCGRVLDVTKLPNWPVPLSWWRLFFAKLVDFLRGRESVSKRWRDAVRQAADRQGKS